MDLGEKIVDFIPPFALWVVFLLVLVAFLVVTAALRYHWKNYDIEKNRGRRIMRIYLLVSAILLFVMVASASIYGS